MQAITNLTGAPQWDAHGRLVPPGRIIAIEEREPEVAAPDTEAAELAGPPIKPEDHTPQKAKPSPLIDGRTGKSGPK